MVVSHALTPSGNWSEKTVTQLSSKPLLEALTVTSAWKLWPGCSVPTFQTRGLGPLFCAGTALRKVRPLPSLSRTTTLVKVKFCRL